MPTTIRPARTKREIDAFLELPYALHAGDPIWTPPLKEDLARSLSDENPLFQEGRGERELLKRGGRFYIVTKMPTAVVPLIFESFGSCDVIENRGYTVVTASA